jgi:hypothetical protein
VVLDRGEIAQEGTHDELLREAEGLYSRLYHDSLVQRDGAVPSRLPTGVDRSDTQGSHRERWAITSGASRRTRTK